MNSAELPVDEVHVHLIDDAAPEMQPQLQVWQGLLSTDEMARSERFHFAEGRRQFLAARGLLRTTLSQYCPYIAPADWHFGVNEWGRPHIKGRGSGRLDFNLSHTKGCVALAVCRAGSPGIDVEWVERLNDLDDIAGRFFAPGEAATLLALPAEARRRRFFELWTLKEAYIKARGMGLSIALDSFEIGFPSTGAPTIEFAPGVQDDAARWRFWLPEIGEDHRLALAVADTDPLTLKLHNAAMQRRTRE